MRRTYSVLLMALMLAPGCRNTVEPSDPGIQPYSSIEMFSGTLSVEGSQFLAFNVLQSATTSITFVGLTAPGTSTTLSVPLSLGFGNLSGDGTSCVPTTTVPASPRLTAHLSQLLSVASYCVVLSDPGNLTGDVDFAVRIAQTAHIDPAGQPGTETFSSNLYPAGAGNRTFVQSETGEVVVRLTSVSPAAAIGLGLGFSSDGSNCFLHQALVSAPGSTAEISASAEPGLYCVRVFDPGGLPQRVVFNVQITHR